MTAPGSHQRESMHGHLCPLCHAQGQHRCQRRGRTCLFSSKDRSGESSLERPPVGWLKPSDRQPSDGSLVTPLCLSSFRSRAPFSEALHQNSSLNSTNFCPTMLLIPQTQPLLWQELEIIFDPVRLSGGSTQNRGLRVLGVVIPWTPRSSGRDPRRTRLIKKFPSLAG